MKIQEMFLTPNQFSRPQKPLTKVTKIAIHYTGNPKSTAIANRNFFENLKNQTAYNSEQNKKIHGKEDPKYVSSHFVVGLQGEIIQCIPLNEYSYCTNQANGYSISIETCHPDSTGKFNDVTEKALAELVAYLLDKFNLTVNDIIRHYDVTGKLCPLYYVNYPAAYENFKKMVAVELDKLKKPEPTKLYRVQLGAFSVKANAEKLKNELKDIGYDGFVVVPDE